MVRSQRDAVQSWVSPPCHAMSKFSSQGKMSEPNRWASNRHYSLLTYILTPILSCSRQYRQLRIPLNLEMYEVDDEEIDEIERRREAQRLGDGDHKPALKSGRWGVYLHMHFISLYSSTIYHVTLQWCQCLYYNPINNWTNMSWNCTA